MLDLFDADADVQNPAESGPVAYAELENALRLIEKGQASCILSFPNRRSLLQALRVGADRCIIDWVTLEREQLPVGTRVSATIEVPGAFRAQVPGVVASRDRLDSTHIRHGIAFDSTHRTEWARLFALASGNANRDGFRRAPRFAIQLAAELRAGVQALSARIADISRRGAGLRLTGLRGINIGDRVMLRIRRGLFRTADLEARVVWVHHRLGDAEVGVQFLEADPDARLWLSQRLAQLAEAQQPLPEMG